MRISKNGWYTLANFLLGVVAFAIYKYFQAAMGQSRTGRDAVNGHIELSF
jgi:hypothetical protein